MNVVTPQIRTAAEQALVDAVDQHLAAVPIAGRVGELRRAAAAAFATHGLPHRRVEEWKYTDLRAILREAPPLAGPLDAASEAEATFKALSVPGAKRILFVNGALARPASDLLALEGGIAALPLDSALAAGEPMADRVGALAPQRYDGPLALNTAFLGEGLVVRVAAHAKIAAPLHIANVFTKDDPATTYGRVVVLVEEGAQVTLVESFQGRDGVAYQTNSALELSVADGAHVDYVRVQEEGDAALHLGTVMLEIGRNAQFHSFTQTSGARASRVSVYGRFSGTHSHAGLRGATLLKGRQHADTTLLLDHAVGHCESRELFKTVLADESHGVFQGKIVVRPDAQKTDGRMMSRALLLGETAEMDNKPELEIFADDVQCGHGATAGELDEDLLFYLKARGIPQKEAEALLVQAFVGEAIEFVEHDALRELLIARAEAWLARRA
ncbi:Fe-S cluster assembly protein SufD [Azorhizobium doebereinerae]|uniref:Fe-S cluster assembly protein SufD n=1 Tax=Azorhizobium doebereinerae TaxID=281091 RepID=UPI00041F5873|nr:Fe-S cluster assembly protein SufD [Azorhizobium doebereinerae]